MMTYRVNHMYFEKPEGNHDTYVYSGSKDGYMIGGFTDEFIGEDEERFREACLEFYNEVEEI